MGDAVPVSAPGAGAAAARSDRKGLASAVPPARVGSFTAGSLRDVKLSSVRLLKSCESMADERRGLQLKEGVDRVRLNAVSCIAKHSTHVSGTAASLATHWVNIHTM